MRRIAASTSSRGWTSRRRTRSACAVASRAASSFITPVNRTWVCTCGPGPSSGVAGGELRELVQPLGRQREAALQAPVERRPAQVQPFRDDLVAADLLHVVIDEQLARLGV